MIWLLTLVPGCANDFGLQATDEKPAAPVDTAPEAVEPDDTAAGEDPPEGVPASLPAPGGTMIP